MIYNYFETERKTEEVAVMPEIFYTQLRETALRVTPEVQGEVIATLPIGSALEVFEERDGYYGVRAFTAERGTISGYVYKSLVNSTEPAEEPVLEQKQILIPPCRDCGATDWRYVPLHAHGHYAYVPLGFMSAVEVKARLCLACGSLVPCLDSEGLEKLRSRKKAELTRSE